MVALLYQSSQTCMRQKMKSRKEVPVNGDEEPADSSLTSRSTGTSASGRSSLPSVVECNTNDSLFLAHVTKVVNDIIFPRKQFIILEEELDVRGKLAAKCLQELKLDISKWSSIKEVVRKRLNQKGNNAMTSVKKSLTSKCIVLFVSTL